MNPQEFLKLMQEIAKIQNKDERDAKAEDLICTALTENGFIAGVEVYEQIKGK